jgi:flagellar basal-body rod modification protein FlgD
MNPISLIDSAARAILGPRPAASGAAAAAPMTSPREARAAQIAKLAADDAAARTAAPKAATETAPKAKAGASNKADEGGKAPDTSAATSEAADRFLTLLVAQLRNQDPLNPLDNAQVTTQLAQLSTVTGINRINETLLALGEAQSAARTLQATHLLGREVAVDGNTMVLGAEAPARAGFALAGAATSVTVQIKDAAGVVVRTMELGPHALGEQRFEWDGKNDAGAAAAPGKYTFTVTATGKDNASVAASGVTIASVTGVYADGTGPRLVLGDLGSVGIDDVRTFN